jgi:aldose 1-epimerase
MSTPVLETALLRDEASALAATFVPGAGMLCSSLCHRGEELLAQNAGVAAYAQEGKTMGVPLLYPWANRLAGFDYSAAGRSVRVPDDLARVRVDQNRLPIHGVVAGLMAWELTPADARDRSPDALAARLSWSDERPQLFDVFPFRHELRYEAALRGGRLEIEVTVDACGEDPVPLSFGFHPYLSPPGAARERLLVELPPMRALALDAKQIPIAAEQALAPQRFELDEREFDDGFDQVREPAHFSVTGAGRRIELTFREGYPYAQVYAPRAGQFICFEPMTAPTNALRSGDGLRVLAPGERFTAGFSIAVADTR